jgi:hypothetical protein
VPAELAAWPLQLRRPVAGFDRVGFAEEKAALGQVFSEHFRLPCQTLPAKVLTAPNRGGYFV